MRGAVRTVQSLLGLAAVAVAFGCGGKGAEQSDRATTTTSDSTPAIRTRAAAHRRGLRTGAPVARIVFPRAERESLVRAGLDQRTIDRGPGWYQRSWLPGEGRLIYLAGHNRTHGGPFGPVADLRRDDTVVLVLPYARATYRVTGRRLVSERQLSILRGRHRELLRLQTSTVPPSDRRIVVSAMPSRLTPR